MKKITSKFKSQNTINIIERVYARASKENESYTKILFSKNIFGHEYLIPWIWAITKCELGIGTLGDDYTIVNPKNRHAVFPNAKRLIKSDPDEEIGMTFIEPSAKQADRLFHIPNYKEISMALMIEDEMASLGHPALDEFYKGLLYHKYSIYSTTIKNGIHISVIADFLITSAYRMISWGLFDWNTEDEKTPKHLFKKAMLRAIPLMEAWSENRFIADEGSEDKIADIFSEHGFVISKGVPHVEIQRSKR